MSKARDGGGRKKKPEPQDQHKDTKMVRLGDDRHERMAELAKRKYRSLSMEVRRAIDYWLACNGEPPELPGEAANE